MAFDIGKYDDRRGGMHPRAGDAKVPVVKDLVTKFDTWLHITFLESTNLDECGPAALEFIPSTVSH